ncbi:MAG: DUF5615 family PIN-like protein [Vulcanimicrobiota bacterium]
MLRFAADENFNNHILRGLERRHPAIDIVRVQDTVMAGSEDPELLEWATNERRIVLTHDVNTMIYYFDERMMLGLPSPGLVLVPQPAFVAAIIEDLWLLASCSAPGELDNRRIYLPLR